MTELPLACSLQGAELTKRAERWRTLADRAQISSARTPNGARQRYCADDWVEAELRELIALEAECCAFLDFQLNRTGGDLVLEISGPPTANEIVGAFATG